MARLTLAGVGVEFIHHQFRHHGLKKLLVRTAVGGGLAETASGQRIVHALDAIDLDIRDGDRLALVGHNGAGKTTILRVMAGVYHPSRGTVVREGHCVPLFDIASGFDDEATGYENMLLRGLLMGLSRAEIERRMDDIAAFSGLGDFLDTPVRTYSSGMLLRLLFSIATSGGADLLLMDEWIAAGDRDFFERANARLKAIVERSGIVVLASHNPELLRSICNRAVLLDKGRIVAEGGVDEVLERYANPPA